MKASYTMPGSRLQILNVMSLRGTSLSTYAGIFVREKKNRQRPGIKREFQNPPSPLDQIELQLHKGCLETIERKKYEGSFDHQKMIFLL